MSFPLYIETYKIGKRNYRRNPVKGQGGLATATGGDTEDLYDDEPIDCALYDGYPDRPEVEEEETDELVMRPEEQAPRPTTSSAPARPGKEQPKQQHQPKPAPKKAQPPVPASQQNASGAIRHAGNKWTASIEVPSIFFGRLIGQRGSALRDLENSTSCRVKIPGKNDKSSIISVQSTVSEECVQRCLDRIEIIIFKAKKECRPQHFVCFSLAAEPITTSYSTFKELVKSFDDIPFACKDDMLYMLEGKLHLTIAAVKLFTDSEVQAAAAVLESAAQQIRKLTGGKEITVVASGLEIMNDDPKNVDVLYGKAHGEKWVLGVVHLPLSLQQAANIIRDALVAKDLTDASKFDVKLHMTVMNSRYQAEANTAKRISFDATSLLKNFGSFDFGSLKVSSVLLCEMGSEDASGFYKTVASASFAP